MGTRTSATNCAQLYNHTLAHRPGSPPFPFSWRYILEVQSSHVWDAFAIFSLLEYHRDYNVGALQVPHGLGQHERFKEAMRKRNAHIKLCGLGKVPHLYNKCTRYWDNHAIGGGICTSFLLSYFLPDLVFLLSASSKDVCCHH